MILGMVDGNTLFLKADNGREIRQDDCMSFLNWPKSRNVYTAWAAKMVVKHFGTNLTLSDLRAIDPTSVKASFNRMFLTTELVKQFIFPNHELNKD